MNDRKCYGTDDCDQHGPQVNYPRSEMPLIIGGGMHDDQDESTGQLLGDVLDLVDRATDYLTPDHIEDRLRQVLGSTFAAADERPLGTGPLTENGTKPLGEDRPALGELVCLNGQEKASAAGSPEDSAGTADHTAPAGPGAETYADSGVPGGPPQEVAAADAEVSERLPSAYAATTFLGALTAEEQQALLAMAHRHVFRKDDVLCREGAPAGEVFVILSGWTRVSVEEGPEQRIIAFRGAGELVGERAALMVRDRSATVTAEGDVHALRVGVRDFASFLDCHPRVRVVLEQHGYRQRVERPARDALPGGSGGNCTVLIADVTGFSSPARTDADRRYIRAAMDRLLNEAFTASGLALSDFYQEDRGDGTLIVVPPTTPTEAVVDPMPAHLAAALRRHNGRATEATRMQLRAGLDVGPVQRDPKGVSGTSIITACRMVDAPAVKKRVAETGAELVFVVSDFVFDTVITSAAGFDDPARDTRVRARPKETSLSAIGDTDDASSGYERVQIRVKDSEATGWMRLMAARSQETNLSPQQIQLLSLIAQGLTADQAARRLGCSARDLRRRLREICDRLEVRTPIEAVVWAVRHQHLGAAGPVHEPTPATRDCADILTKVDLYLDGEVEDADMTDVRNHLDDCPACLREYGLHHALQTVVAQAGGGDSAPTGLRDRILSRLAQLGADEGANPASERVHIGGGWEASSP